MRAIISRILSLFSGGRTRRTHATTRRRGLLARVGAALKAFFSGGRHRRY